MKNRLTDEHIQYNVTSGDYQDVIVKPTILGIIMSKETIYFGAATPDQAILKSIIDLGYKTIFDIATESQGHFIEKLPSFNTEQVKQVHNLAKSRVHSLVRLYRALQARNDPTLHRIPKLGISSQPEALSEALRRALNGAPDFSELFPPRSLLYADAGSIQSLFSPGRYATELYRVAQGLHPTNNPLNIDNRRPDIATTILNEQALTTTLPEIEILNGILFRGLEKNKVDLATVTYPWVLPYDNDLAKIRCVFSTLGISIQSIWKALADYQWTMFNPITFAPPPPDGSNVTPTSPYTREQLELTPKAYELLVSPPATAADIKKRYNLDTPLYINELCQIPTFTDRTGLTFNQLIDLTAQKDYQASTLPFQMESHYYNGGYNTPAHIDQVWEYGQRYISNGADYKENLLVVPKGNIYVLNLDQLYTDGANKILDKAERFIRLQRQVKIDFAQFDFLIFETSMVLLKLDVIELDNINTTVLNAIAEFCRLRDTYSISPDTFVCFISEMNTHRTKYGTSMFETQFRSPTSGALPPMPGIVDFNPDSKDPNTALIAGGLGVSQNTLYEMAALAFTEFNFPKVYMNAINYAQLYRLAIIPRMLGVTFPIARTLWQLLDPTQDLALKVAKAVTLDTLPIIQQTESVLSWMTEYQLDIASAIAMITNAYSAEPTPEILNLLDNIYTSLGNDPTANRYRADTPISDSLRDMLCRIIASAFQLKANVMSQLIVWQDLYFTSQLPGGVAYGLNDYWAEIDAVFSAGKPTLDALASAPNLIRYTNALGQHAMIALWGHLTEQDLQLFIDTPQWFFDGNPTKTPRPSFPVLLLLSRLTAWQQRIKTTEAKALAYFRSANQTSQTTENALALLAEIQGWEVNLLKEMNSALAKEGVYGGNGEEFPRTFQQLNRLDTWMRTADQLQTGASCIDQLYQMSLSNVAAENPLLLKAVADALVASTQSPIQVV